MNTNTIIKIGVCTAVTLFLGILIVASIPGDPREKLVETTREIDSIKKTLTLTATTKKTPDVKVEYIGHGSGNAVYRLVDSKAHVLCYFASTGGISCMPLHDFPLEGKVNLGIYK